MKKLTHDYPPVEVIFWRSFVIACAFSLYFAVGRKPFSWHILRPAVLLRCLFDSANSFCFVIAISRLDLAVTYAVLLMTPFLMTILAVIFLKEPVGWRRWLAIAGGFAGSMLIIKPSAQGFSYWAAVAFVAALAGALRDFATAKIDPALSTVEVSLLAAVVTGVAAVGEFIFGIGQSWRLIVTQDVYLLPATAVGSLIGTVLLIRACRIGPLYIAAAFRFMLIIWGGAAGYFVFGNIPDSRSVLGAAIIVTCAFYVLYREAIVRRAVALPRPRELH